jgi:Tfp pilus assembly protein PilO
MSRIRGNEVYVIAGVVAVILVLAWWFLLLSPTRSDVATLNTQIAQEQLAISTAQSNLVRLEQYKKTAPQARADIVSLSKALPGSEGIPSMLIELGQTASASGVDLTSISKGQTQPGSPFGVQAITLMVSGHYFDLEDFFYRLEHYVDVQNDHVKATGRLLELTSVQVAGGQGGTTTGSGSPVLQATVILNAYLQPPSATTATAGASTGGGQ